jgi:hypothetical protein
VPDVIAIANTFNNQGPVFVMAPLRLSFQADKALQIVDTKTRLRCYRYLLSATISWYVDEFADYHLMPFLTVMPSTNSGVMRTEQSSSFQVDVRGAHTVYNGRGDQEIVQPSCDRGLID